MSNEDDPIKGQEGIQIEKVGDKVNIILDMSMFDLFEMCEARYNMRHNFNYALPMIQKPVALDSGSLVHEGFDVYFNGIKQGIHYDDRMQAALQKIMEISADPEKCNLEMEEVSTVLSAFEQSCDFWRFEDEQMIIHEVESAFARIVYEDDVVRIILTGRIDLLVDIPSVGGSSSYTNLPIDHKSFKRDFEVPRLSNQFMNYCSAADSNYIKVNRVGLQRTLPPEQKFKRVILSYDPIMLKDWETNVIRVLLTRYLNCVASGYWNMNFTSCFKFNRKCEYYEICETSGEENKLRKLSEGFDTISPWDVTASFTKG